MRYRRSQQSGGSFFFTLVTYERQPILTRPDHIDRLRAAFKREIEKYPFALDAIVILPDHLHALWHLPEGDRDFSGRWSRIKRYFSIGCVGATAEQSDSRRQKRERMVWQRRFWEHTIRDEEDWRRHIDYIHFNPVKHGYARSAGEWPHSSFQRCVQKGWYAPDWGRIEPTEIQGFNFE
jgi:putative transposase